MQTQQEATKEAATPAPNPTESVATPLSETPEKTGTTNTEAAAGGSLLEDKQEAAPESKPPEKYELKVPDGLEPEYADQIASFAREQGLSEAAAQAMLERDAQLIAHAREEQQRLIEQQSEQWISNLKTDKEFGGERYNETVELARRVWQRFGPKDAQIGHYGNNDVLIKTLAAVGRVMHEDTLINGGVKVAPKSKTLAQRLYPDLE